MGCLTFIGAIIIGVLLIGLFFLIGHFTLVIMYGPHNFDYGMHRVKIKFFAFLSTVFIATTFVTPTILIVYLIVLVFIGLLHRVCKKTSFTRYGDIAALASIRGLSDEYKTEYIRRRVPREYIEFCEEYRGYDRVIFKKLERGLSEQVFNLTCAEILWERYKDSADPEKYPPFNPTTWDEYQLSFLTGKEIVSDERYKCRYIKKKKTDIKPTTCFICQEDIARTLCEVRSNVGTRDLKLCNECIEKFEFAAAELPPK